MRYNLLGNNPVVGGDYHHGYVVVTMDRGSQFFARFGPTNPLPRDKKNLKGLLSHDFGALDFESGRHGLNEGPGGRKSVDYAKEGDYVVGAKIEGSDLEITDSALKIAEFGQRVEDEKAPYHITKSNSNAAIHQAWEEATGERPEVPEGANPAGHETTVVPPTKNETTSKSTASSAPKPEVKSEQETSTEEE